MGKKTFTEALSALKKQGNREIQKKMSRKKFRSKSAGKVFHKTARLGEAWVFVYKHIEFILYGSALRFTLICIGLHWFALKNKIWNRTQKSSDQERMSFPDKERRKKCWDARDEYWKCLDGAESKEAGSKACKNLRAMFIEECPTQWVSRKVFAPEKVMP